MNSAQPYNRIPIIDPDANPPTDPTPSLVTIPSVKKEPKKRFFGWFSKEPQVTYRSKLHSKASSLNILARKFEDYCLKEYANNRGLGLEREDYALKDENFSDLWENSDILPSHHSTYIWLDKSKLHFTIFNGPDDKESMEEGETTDESTIALYTQYTKAKEAKAAEITAVATASEALKNLEKDNQKTVLSVKTGNEEEALKLGKENKKRAEVLLIMRKKEEEKALFALKDDLAKKLILREKVTETLNPLSFIQGARFEDSSDRTSVGTMGAFAALISIVTFFRVFMSLGDPIFAVIVSLASTATAGIRWIFFNRHENKNALNINMNKTAKAFLNKYGFSLGFIAFAISFINLFYSIGKFLFYTSPRFIFGSLSILGIGALAGSAIVATVCTLPFVIATITASRFFVHMGHIWSHLEILGFMGFMGTPKYAIKKPSSKKSDTPEDSTRIDDDKTLYLKIVEKFGKKIIQYQVRARYKVEYLSQSAFDPDTVPSKEFLKDKHRQSLYFWKSTDNKICYSAINPQDEDSDTLKEPITNSLHSLFGFKEHPTNEDIKTLSTIQQNLIQKLLNHTEQHSLTTQETDELNNLILKKHAELRTLITVDLQPKHFDFSATTKNYIELAEKIKAFKKTWSSQNYFSLENLNPDTAQEIRKLGISLDACNQLCTKIHDTPEITLEELEQYATELQYQELTEKIERNEDSRSSFGKFFGQESAEDKLIRKAAAVNGHPYQLPIEERERFKTQLVKREIQATGALGGTLITALVIAGVIGASAASFGLPLVGAATLLGVGMLGFLTVVAFYTASREYERWKTEYRRERFGSHLEKITAKFHKLAQQPLVEKVAGYIQDPNNPNETLLQKQKRYGCPIELATDNSDDSLHAEKSSETRKKEKIERFKALNICPDGSDLIIIDHTLWTPNDPVSTEAFLKSLPTQFTHGYILIQDNLNNPTKLSLYFYDKTMPPAVLVSDKTFAYDPPSSGSKDTKEFNFLKSLLETKSSKLYTSENPNIARLSFKDLKKMQLTLSVSSEVTQSPLLFPHLNFGSVKNTWGDKKFASHSHLGGMNNDLNLIFNPNSIEPDSRKGYYDSDFISSPAAENDFFDRITREIHSPKTEEQYTILLDIIAKKIPILRAELTALKGKEISFDIFGSKQKNVDKLKECLDQSIQALLEISVLPKNTKITQDQLNRIDQKTKTELFISTKNMEKQLQLARLNGVTEDEIKKIATDRQATALIYLIGKIQDKRGALLQEVIDLGYNIDQPESISEKMGAFFSSHTDRQKFNRLLQKEQFHQCLLLLLLGEPINTSDYQALFPNHALSNEHSKTPVTLSMLQELDDYFMETENYAVKDQVFKSKKKVSNAHAMMEAVNIYFVKCAPDKEDSKAKTYAALDRMPSLMQEAEKSTQTIYSALLFTPPDGGTDSRPFQKKVKSVHDSLSSSEFLSTDVGSVSPARLKPGSTSELFPSSPSTTTFRPSMQGSSVLKQDSNSTNSAHLGDESKFSETPAVYTPGKSL